MQGRLGAALGSGDQPHRREPGRTVEEIAERLRAALGHIDAARLAAAPDCGLAMLPRDLTRQKLANLCTAAHALP